MASEYQSQLALHPPKIAKSDTSTNLKFMISPKSDLTRTFFEVSFVNSSAPCLDILRCSSITSFRNGIWILDSHSSPVSVISFELTSSVSSSGMVGASRYKASAKLSLRMLLPSDRILTLWKKPGWHPYNRFEVMLVRCSSSICKPASLLMINRAPSSPTNVDSTLLLGVPTLIISKLSRLNLTNLRILRSVSSLLLRSNRRRFSKFLDRIGWSILSMRLQFPKESVSSHSNSTLASSRIPSAVRLLLSALSIFCT